MLQNRIIKMKAALLKCDHVTDHRLDIDGDYEDMFRKFLPAIDFQVYNVIDNQFPASANDIDLYIVSGSQYSVYEEKDWILKLKQFVREIKAYDKYYLGFCFGHQLIGEALGGKVERNEDGWCVGLHTFDVAIEQEWMVPNVNSVAVMMSCQDQIIKLPDGAKCIAGSSECPNGIIQLGSKMIGIQGHPEFSKEYDLALIEGREEQIGWEKVNEAKKSVQNPHDGELIAKWLMKFIGSPNS